MAKIYSIDNNTDNTNYFIASKGYVDDLIKQLEDILIDHMNNYGSAHDPVNKVTTNSVNTTEYTVEKLDSSSNSTTSDTVKASDVVTDAENGFISQSTLMSLKQRPTSLEVSKQIDEARDAINNSVQERMDELLNTEYSMTKIKDLINIIKEDNLLEGLSYALSSKLPLDEFTKHINSAIHLDNNDRKALNVLIALTQYGSFADWNASENDYTFIKNKPNSLPANGGNADTVGGLDLKYLVNKQSSDLIIGIEGYSEYKADIFINDDYSNIDDVKSAITDMLYGKIDLKSGVYVFDTLGVCYDRTEKSSDLIITGAGNSTVITSTEVTLNQHVKVRDIFFKSSTIHFGTNCELDNCEFEDCSIYLEVSVCSTIKNCNFKKCSIYWKGSCTGNIIAYNRFKSINGMVNYLGNKNIINNNIIE